VKYGFVLPFGDARTAANLARDAEQAGWDAFFVWEPVWGIDAWVALTAAAMVTEKIRLGTMLTPVSRMRPWKLASETATLDNLSGGRVILAVGFGAIDTGFAEFGEATDRKTRAELLDEGLDIVTGLWRGQPFEYNGKHYRIKPTGFHMPPPPVQKPIPIWVVGAWKSEKSMTRVLKYDGLLPNVMKDGKHVPATPEDIRATTPFDIVWEGTTPGDHRLKAKSMVQPYADAGATWWNETAWEEKDIDKVRERIKQGPPRID
jgi:hypothetical protein